jgi:hypothetical protein
MDLFPCPCEWGEMLTLFDFLERANLNHLINHVSQSQNYLMTDGQSASLSWYQATFWDLGLIFFFTSMENIIRHSLFSSYGEPSLRREWVCNLCVQLLLGLTSAVTLRSKSHRTCDYILLSHLRLRSLFAASYVSQGYVRNFLFCLHM